MQLENRFDVPASPEAAWALLNDVPLVLPCMPGAELVDVVDADTWKARLRVRLGPISLQFLADLSRETTELERRQAVISVDAREAKGRGTARATITSTVQEAPGGASVSIVTELALRGPLAQYGRPVVAPVAEQLTQQFAACISQKLAATASEHEPRPDPQEPAPPPDAPKPIGLRFLLGALWRSMTRKES
jgi:carbon monoxide dehydrogenase subunit G